jgi:heme/copper-type cytochrome/quinol oxidase subunit 3
MLIVLTGKVNRPITSTTSVYWLKTGAIYWHMVDVLWLWLFPILYLQDST